MTALYSPDPYPSCDGPDGDEEARYEQEQWEAWDDLAPLRMVASAAEVRRYNATGLAGVRSEAGGAAEVER